MREGWTYKKLGDIATYINGFAFKPSDWGTDGLPIIRIQNLTGTQPQYNKCSRKDIPEKYIVRKGDVLISWSATLGVFEWQLDDAFLNQHIFKVVFDKVEIDKRYFEYAILISINLMAQHTNGATMKHIRKGDFDNIKIPFPPLSEQQRIVAQLDEAFAEIDLIKAEAEKQLSDAKALFQKALSQAMTPKEGWEKKKLGEVCDIIGGGTPSKKNSTYYNGNIPWATVRDMNCDILSSTEFKISREGLNDSASHLIDKGEIIIATRVGLGKVCKLAQQTAINQDLKGIIPIKNNISRDYLFYYFRSIADYIEENGVGATVKGVKIKFIENLCFPLPPLSDQQRIVEELDELSENVKEIEALNNKLTVECDAMKQALLRQVFE